MGVKREFPNRAELLRCFVVRPPPVRGAPLRQEAAAHETNKMNQLGEMPS